LKVKDLLNPGKKIEIVRNKEKALEITLYRAEHFPNFENLEETNDWLGFSSKPFREKIKGLKEDIYQEIDELLKKGSIDIDRILSRAYWMINDFLVRQNLTIFKGGYAVVEDKKEERKIYVNLSRAFNLGLIEIDFKELTKEEAERLEKQMADTEIDTEVEIRVYDAVVKGEEIDIYEARQEFRATIGRIDNIKKQIDDFLKRQGVEYYSKYSSRIMIKIKSPFAKYLEQIKNQHSVDRYFSDVLPEKTVEIVQNGSYKDIDLLGIALEDKTLRFGFIGKQKEFVDYFKDRLFNKKKDVSTDSIKEEVNLFLDRLENAIFRYANEHPLNKKGRKIERLAQLLRENGRFFHIVENEIGSAYKEVSESFNLIYEGQSFSNTFLDLEIYQYGNENLYFVEAVKEGLSGYNFSYFVSLDSDTDIELLKYTDLDIAKSSMKRYSQERMSEELGLVVEELNPEEIAQLILIEGRGPKL